MDVWRIRDCAEQLHAETQDIDLLKIENDELITQATETPDPWGNEYQICELQNVDQQLAGDCPFHVYTLGEDGITRTDGNDPDDINSWNLDSGRFYARRVARHWESEKLWQTVWTTPILLALAWLTKIAFGKIAG